MKLKGLALTAGALAIVAAALVPVALKAAPKAAGSHEIAGTWQIDLKNSDMPRRGEGMGGMRGGEGMGRRGGGMGGPPPERGWGNGGGGEGGDRPGGGGRRGLPRLMRIVGSDQGYAISDSSGTIVQDISFAPVSAADGDKTPPMAQGTWKGDKLVVTRTSPRGAMTETFEIEKGQLVVRMKMERKEGGDFETKRVYTRAS